MKNLLNIKEEIVKQALDEICKVRDDFCKCETCKLDIMALTLNSISPKYIVTEKGYLFSRADQLKLQKEVDITVEINKAIKVVKNNPRHD